VNIIAASLRVCSGISLNFLKIPNQNEVKNKTNLYLEILVES